MECLQIELPSNVVKYECMDQLAYMDDNTLEYEAQELLNLLL